MTEIESRIVKNDIFSRREMLENWKTVRTPQWTCARRCKQRVCCDQRTWLVIPTSNAPRLPLLGKVVIIQKTLRRLTIKVT